MRYWTRALFAIAFLALGAPAIAADAVATGDGGSVTLGKNWGSYETFQGSSFRWVANDAQILVRGNGPQSVRIACEGGPSLGQPSFPLRVLDASRRQVDHVECAGKDHPAMMLLPAGNAETGYTLHVDGGNRSVPNEKRVLNFRVFVIDGGGGTRSSGPDVLDPRNGIRLGAHWYPVERFKGQTFRWMDGNDAQLFVMSNRDLDTKLRLLIGVGPSAGARQGTVAVRDAAGKNLQTATIANQSAVVVSVHLKPGENEFLVHIDAMKNVPVPGDKRILNLRLFNAAALR